MLNTLCSSYSSIKERMGMPEEGKTSNTELRKCSQQEHLFLRIHMIKEKAWRNHGTDNYD